MQEGTEEASVCLRHYGATIRQLLRTANWGFARKQAALTLLQDATGVTTQQQIDAGQPVTVGVGTIGMRPWLYEYRWPVDCVRARFVPVQMYNPTQSVPGNIAIPSTPITTAAQPLLPYTRLIPAPFLVSRDDVPNFIGVPTDWSQIPDTSQTMGQALAYQSVILTNQPNATLVYTALNDYPDQWDPLFQQAVVATLASLIAAPLVEDARAKIAIRNDQIKIAKMSIEQARIADGDEANTVVDHRPDWLRIRNTGSRWGNWGPGGGAAGWGYGWGGGWDSMSFCDGSVY